MDVHAGLEFLTFIEILPLQGQIKTKDIMSPHSKLQTLTSHPTLPAAIVAETAILGLGLT